MRTEWIIDPVKSEEVQKEGRPAFPVLVVFGEDLEVVVENASSEHHARNIAEARFPGHGVGKTTLGFGTVKLPEKPPTVYTCRRTGASSEKFGVCEVCQKYADTVYIQTRYNRYDLAEDVRAALETDARYSWTHEGSSFGHEACLVSRRVEGSAQVDKRPAPDGRKPGCAPECHSEAKHKTFVVPDVGHVCEKNAVWMYCNDRDQVAALKVGDSCPVVFQTGMGRTKGIVERTS